MYYVDCMKSAKELFFSHRELNATLAFVGHYHVPQVYTKESDNFVAGGRIVFDRRNQEQPVPFERCWPLKTGDTALVVVPSVGQPRDQFYYTGYVIYDSANEQLIMRRIPYDVSRTQSTMRSLDFPSKLRERLTHGK